MLKLNQVFGIEWQSEITKLWQTWNSTRVQLRVIRKGHIRLSAPCEGENEGMKRLVKETDGKDYKIVKTWLAWRASAQGRIGLSSRDSVLDLFGGAMYLSEQV